MGMTVGHAFLALGMLITGTINTIMTTWQDKTYSMGRDGNIREYSHPWFQTLTMFIGEFLCLVVFYLTACRSKQKNYDETVASMKSQNPVPPSNDKMRFLIFSLPTICDLSGTTVMNIGLLYTTASVYQMIRGATVLFTAIFSVIFLKRRLYIQHIIGLIFVITGIFLVGLSSVLFSTKTAAKNPALGNALIFFAQIIVAAQFVVEEKFISKYDIPPMQAVGLEGTWGIMILGVVLLVLQYAAVNGRQPIEDSIDAMIQITNSWPLIIGSLGSIFSIAFFNFFGLSVTKQLSATHRTTIDSCRTVLIWMVSLALGWESFIGLQVVGFTVLVIGTFLYNDVISLPAMDLWRCVFWEGFFIPEQELEKEHLLDESHHVNWYSDNFEQVPTHPSPPLGSKIPTLRRASAHQPL